MTDSEQDEDNALGRLVAEYSGKINELRRALLWIREHSNDPAVIRRCEKELGIDDRQRNR
jgi:hypothetical protein